jgi:putative nucleotidyltransferase with HDIG domain
MATQASQAIDLDALIKSSTSIEPIPASVLRLSGLVCADAIDTDAITETISFDQALAGAVLRSANSATSASRSAISTVRDAVHRLGPPTVLSIALGTSVKSQMNDSVPEYGLEPGALWRHSVAASLAAEVIRASAKVRVPNEAVTAALLHDIGKVVLARHLASDVLLAISTAIQNGTPRVEAELEILEVHHGEVGGLIAQAWGLPDGIGRAIRYHHHPDLALEPVVDAVYLANVVADATEENSKAREHLDETQIARVMDRLGIATDSWPVLVATVTERYAALSARYN